MVYYNALCNSAFENLLGGVEGKGVLKWFKIMTWMSVYTGEVEVPYIFAKVYGAGITKNARLVMPDGFISAC